MASGKFTMVVAAVVMMSWVASTQSQTPPDTSCITALMPCKNFVNSTSPPATCCGPLKEAFKTQLKCLCAIFDNPALAAATNVNITQVAVELPKNCGIMADPTACSKLAPQASNAGPKALAPEGASSPSLSKPAQAPGTGAASSITPVSSLLLVVIGFMFY